MNRPPTVLHVIRPQPVGRTGGADLHLLDLVERQLANGHHVAVLALGNRQFGRRAATLGALDAGGERWPSRVVSLIRHWPVDIVHGHGYSADLVAVALRRHSVPAAGPRIVLTVHGFIRTSPWLRLRTTIDEHCLALADALIASSEAEAARLRARMPTKRIWAILNGVHIPPRAAAGPTRAVRRIAFVGRLSPEKRPDRFLAVAARLARDDETLQFVLIGSGALERSLRALAADLGIATRCQFTGLIHDVNRWLGEEIDLLVSLSDSEGTPRAVLEAMACGLPVVATAVGGLPELITSGVDGLLVHPAGDVVVDATSAVRRLLADGGLRDAVGKEAIRTVRARFTLDSMVAQVSEAYGSILGEERRESPSVRKG